MANNCSNTLTVKPTNKTKAAKKQLLEFISQIKDDGEIVKSKDAKEFKTKFMEENFENKYRDDAKRFVSHSKMSTDKVMTEVCRFKSIEKGKDKYFVRNESKFSMQNLLPCPAELLKVTSPVRAENGENEAQFKERVTRHLKLYDAKDWYSWRCNNWGCKSDVWRCGISENENEIIYYYDTPWQPNKEFIREIAQNFLCWIFT